VWLHEIKHDGFRVVARKQDDRVRLYSRLGNDLRQRFPSVAEALHGLNLHSCILDGEAVAYDDARMLRSAAPPRPNGAVSLYAFDPPAVETAGARTGHRMELDRGSAPMVTHFHVILCPSTMSCSHEESTQFDEFGRRDGYRHGAWRAGTRARHSPASPGKSGVHRLAS
jgi:hypothetical protein